MEYKKNGEQKSRVKRMIKLYTKMLMNNDIDYIKLKNVYNRSIGDNYAEAKIRTIIRLQESQKLIESEILALYESEGITAKEVIKRENNVYLQSIEKSQLAVSDRINERIGKRIGMDPKEVKQTFTIKTDYKALLEETPGQLAEGKKQLKRHNGDGDDD